MGTDENQNAKRWKAEAGNGFKNSNFLQGITGYRGRQETGGFGYGLTGCNLQSEVAFMCNAVTMNALADC